MISSVHTVLFLLEWGYAGLYYLRKETMNSSPGPLRGNDIRRRNEKLILNIIHKSDGISQSEVANMTGLKPPTVLRIFTKLEEKNLIQVSTAKKTESDRKGRRPVFYVVRSGAAYAVGVDFWAQSMTVVVVDFARRPVYTRTEPLKPEIAAEELMKSLEEMIDQALGSVDAAPGEVLGIGVGAPGRVDIGEGKVLYYSRIPGMVRFPVRSRLESRFQIPVHVHNNSSVIALNEFRYGQARGVKSLLTILVRSGVGGAFINEGKLLVTGDRTTLELGHMSVDINGLECDCGRQGCLETYISEQPLLNALGRSDLNSLDSFDDSGWTDAELSAYLEDKGRYLAAGIRNLYELFSPDVFLLITRSGRISAQLAELARRGLMESTRNIPEQECRILPVTFEPAAAGMGAADLVFENYFSSERAEG